MFTPSEWRILVVLTALFLSGAAWHVVEANAPLPALSVQGSPLAWSDPSEPESPASGMDAHEGTSAKKGPAHKRKPLLTGLVNPNKATLEQLQGLPGVGEKMAARIIEERANGPFKDLDDIQRVKGIGPKKAEKMRPWLRFD